MSGWNRLYIFTLLIWTVGVGSFTYINVINTNVDIIKIEWAEKIMSLSWRTINEDITREQYVAREMKKRSVEQIIDTSPKSRQSGKFKFNPYGSIPVVDLEQVNRRYNALISQAYKNKKSVFFYVLFWLVPAFLTYVLGFGISWVWTGFRK